MKGLHWVRLDRLATDPVLTPDQKIGALTKSIEWLGVAQGLIMIHGHERAAKRLDELGCPIRFDVTGAPVVAVEMEGK
jgi:hypothetical protein